MRTLTSTLLAAQKQASAIPYVKVEAKNLVSGVVRYDWTRLYNGTETDYFHAITMPGDGSLIRARITPPSDSRKLYRQRVSSPGPSSDFSQWTYTSQYNAVVVAAASLGAEASIFWINTSREIRRIKSTDYGATWGSPELIDYSPTTAIYGLAAAYKTGGDLAIFFADQATLYVKKCVSGSWQTKAAWDKTTGDLSGAACAYSGDWNLLITGKDSSGNFKLWSLVYGDGGDVTAGTWSALRELASAPSGGSFEYLRPFLDKPDVFRSFFVEKFAGTEAYNRPFWSHIAVGAKYVDNLWREPVPFNLSSDYGLAIAHYGDYCWLSCPAGVWRTPINTQSLDLTGDVMSARHELEGASGKLTVELRNDDGRYASPGQGNLSILNTGCQVDFSPGFATSAGNEVSSGQSFCLEAYEHTSSGGRASLILYTLDGWAALANWKARHQFRWNKLSSDMSVKEIIAFVLARVGLKLEVKSESSVITGFYPDFSINPADSGGTVIQKLLSFVPDVLFIEGSKAYIVNPQSSDSSVYSYGTDHQILEGRYRQDAWKLNRAQVSGYDGSGNPIIADRFAWSEIDRLYDRMRQIEDRNIDAAGEAQQRGDAYLRQAEIESAGGAILVPVNCGQQMYDVINITDSRAGLSATKKRVRGLTLVYNPRRAEYTQRLQLGAV
ncbi:MAG: hypothetical protein Q7R57_10235 [Dehalococcoidales bacterium]|nr:hypothetical protein [Dehalococcoidales bacterium]